MKLPLHSMVLRAALEYFSVVFAGAFMLGILRTLVIAPRLGDLWAVLLELPLVLALSWVVAGRVLRRWPIAAGGPMALLATGAVAFVLLMLVEVVLATQAFGETWPAYWSRLTTSAGLVGLVGQAAFAAIPWLRDR